MKNCIFIIAALLGSCSLFAQTAEDERMERDLEVAAEVLATLLEQGQERHTLGFWRDDVNARYVDGLGVVFSVPHAGLHGSSYRIITSEEEDGRDKVIFKSDKGVDDMIIKGEKITLLGEDSENSEDANDHLIETVKLFLADYGGLMQSLKMNDRILVRQQSRRGNQLAWAMAIKGGNRKLPSSKGLEIGVSMSDIFAFEKGEIDRETFDSRVTITEDSEESMKEEPELAVFGSILYRVFKPDFSKTYYMDSSPWHERLSDFGVTYHVKVYSSSSENGLHYITTLDKGNLTQQERNDIVESMYDDFVASFKQNVLDYGHALRNLDEAEVLIFDIDLTECKGCDMPKEIELSIKKSVLTKYRKDEIYLEEAMEAFALKKLR